MKQKRRLLYLIFLFTPAVSQAQVNYVPNPSFEQHTRCPYDVDQIKFATGWQPIDTVNHPPSDSFGDGNCTPEYCNTCAGNNVQSGVPQNQLFYQYPRTGNGMAQMVMYNDKATSYYQRDYLQARLTQPLISGQSYCVTFFVISEQQSYYAVNHIGAYLDNGSIDSVQFCGFPQTNYTPQVQTLSIINDTLNWVKIQGSFIANGTEQYITIGNFYDKTHTSSTSQSHTTLAIHYAIYLVDDVSVVESDLPASAGGAKFKNKEDSVFIGRSEIIPDCRWYRNGVLIDTVHAGLWVKDTTTTTYVLEQSICGNTLYDTAIVNVTNNPLVPCRPQVCLIDYNYHNDNSSNSDMTAIKAALPDILIDNTPGGYWGGACLPPQYTPLGIQVFSYITSGYEGTEYHSTEDSLASNIARVDAIANDGATGVFLDEVSNTPSSASKNYISSIFNECQAKGLKLILNPGTNTFDPWLISHCDYLMSDENYDGTRTPTASEDSFLNRILVVAQNVTSAASAATITDGARAHGFGYSYACSTYTSLPTWLSNYCSLITNRPTTPVITSSGKNFQSNAPYGNQWYGVNQGLISGATGQTFNASQNDTYFDIVTLSDCSSANSNLLATGIGLIDKPSLAVSIYPNPATSEITIGSATSDNISLIIYDMSGRAVLKQNIQVTSGSVRVPFSLSAGVYIVELLDKDGRKNIQRLSVR